MAVAFSGSGEEVISRQISLTAPLANTCDDIVAEFDLSSIADWIETHHFCRVALQFPDNLLSVSAEIALFLEKKTSAEIVVLADTSYGSCCVDEVAAEHYCSDSIVHFGHACLSPTPGKLPVRYEFGRQNVDTENCVLEVLRLVPDRTKTILLVYDPIFHHAVCTSVVEELTEHLPNLIVPSLVLPNSDGSMPTHEDISDIHFGRNFQLQDGRSISDCTILYIGDPDSQFLSAFLMNFSHCRCICYDVASSKCIADAWSSNRALARRYYLVECARDAHRVGILIGTLGVADYLNISARLESVIRRAGKAVYRFVVGKLNVAKLANFADIDVFVLVACPENSLVDSKDFYRPIVTPFEMEMACCSERQWTGNYEVDFRQMLPGGAWHLELTEEQGAVNEEQADMSLITGKVRHFGIDDSEVVRTIDSAGVVVKRNDQMTVATNSAASFLSERSWQGLDPQLGKTAVTVAVEGSKGIAMNYDHEPSST